MSDVQSDQRVLLQLQTSCKIKNAFNVSHIVTSEVAFPGQTRPCLPSCLVSDVMLESCLLLDTASKR